MQTWAHSLGSYTTSYSRNICAAQALKKVSSQLPADGKFTSSGREGDGGRCSPGERGCLSQPLASKNKIFHFSLVRAKTMWHVPRLTPKGAPVGHRTNSLSMVGGAKQGRNKLTVALHSHPVAWAVDKVSPTLRTLMSLTQGGHNAAATCIGHGVQATLRWGAGASYGGPGHGCGPQGCACLPSLPAPYTGTPGPHAGRPHRRTLE